MSHARRTGRSSNKPLPHGISGKQPICFVTVSPRLRKELDRRYHEIEAIEKIVLPPVCFFSFRELLDGLLAFKGVSDMRVSDACNFFDYVHSRTSHSPLTAEESLIENEIGGVIMGSLKAAKKKSSLSRDDYLSEKRSNVSDTQEGLTQKQLIFDEYERYRKWKVTNEKYDVNDIVLRLISMKREQIFESGEALPCIALVGFNICSTTSCPHR